MGNELFELPAPEDVVQAGIQLGGIVPSLLKDFPLMPKPPIKELKSLPSLSLGVIGERAVREGAKIVGKEAAKEGTKLLERLRAPGGLSVDSMKSVDAATDALKQLGLDPEAADMFGKVMKKALELSTDVKSVGCSLTKDGKPRIKVEFNSPMSVGPLTLGEKAPLEFTISPSASKAGIAFTDIRGAQIGIGPLQTDLTSASLSFKGNEPKLTLNKTVTLPLSGLIKLVAK